MNILEVTYADRAGKLTVGDKEINGDLEVKGDVTLEGALEGGNISSTGTITAEGGMVCESNMQIDGNLTIDGEIISDNDISTSGDITGGSIIENMSGYSFTKSSHSGYTYNVNYAGVVKNGNKITFVIAYDITKNDSSAGNDMELGYFNIPAAVGNSLVPNALGYIDQRDVLYFSSAIAVSSKPIWVQKENATTIKISIYNGGIIVGTKYYARLETTFLLSDNLAV